MNGRTIVSSMHVALVAGSLWWGASSPVSAQTLSQYTSEPPFLTEGVVPTLLLLMDNSGSMDSSAYHNANEALPAKAYYGYFDPTLCYSYGSSRYQIGTPRAATAPTWGATYPWGRQLPQLHDDVSHGGCEVGHDGWNRTPRAGDGTCYPGGGKLRR